MLRSAVGAAAQLPLHGSRCERNGSYAKACERILCGLPRPPRAWRSALGPSMFASSHAVLGAAPGPVWVMTTTSLQCQP